MIGSTDQRVALRGCAQFAHGPSHEVGRIDQDPRVASARFRTRQKQRLIGRARIVRKTQRCDGVSDRSRVRRGPAGISSCAEQRPGAEEIAIGGVVPICDTAHGRPFPGHQRILPHKKMGLRPSLDGVERGVISEGLGQKEAVALTLGMRNSFGSVIYDPTVMFQKASAPSAPERRFESESGICEASREPKCPSCQKRLSSAEADRAAVNRLDRMSRNSGRLCVGCP